MFSRIVRNNGSLMSKRFQSQASTSASAKSAFNNKYNFNINPPPVHTYWSMRNSSVLLAFIPVYLLVGYAIKYSSSGLSGYEGLYAFADSEKSPMKELKFGEAQASKN